MQENITKEDLSLINSYAQSELTEDELFTFSLVLCTDSVDRDMERFSRSSLEKLAALFKGKTGIFDHDPKGEKQTARIFRCCVETAESGESRLKARAYMVRTGSNADLIAEIRGGIKKEVSVSCAVKRRVCSLCGADVRKSPCSHVKGQYYGGKLCEVILDEPTDAYEWSFVAIPAQVGAGITKAHGGASDDSAVKALREMLDGSMSEVSKAKRDIISEIVRLGQFTVPAYDGDAVKAMCESMDISGLIAFKERTRSLAKPEKVSGILGSSEDEEESDGGECEERIGLFRLGRRK